VAVAVAMAMAMAMAVAMAVVMAVVMAVRCAALTAPYGHTVHHCHTARNETSVRHQDHAAGWHVRCKDSVASPPTSNPEYESMNTRLRTALVAALLTAFASAAVAAGDDVTVKLITDGDAEVVNVPLDTLAVGESRQLTAASGLPAIVTRTEQVLTIEIAGRTTEVKLRDGAALGMHGMVDGGHPVRFFKHERIEHDGTAVDGEKRRVVVRHAGHADDGHVTLDDEGLQALLDEAGIDGSGDGTKVIVIRRKQVEASTD
jgi:hypothetical protein